jgi:hypothetical protein
MSLKRKEYKVDDHAEKATRFFVACKANPATKVKVTEAMQVRVYFDCKSADLMLQMQVHCRIQWKSTARQEPKRGRDQSPDPIAVRCQFQSLTQPHTSSAIWCSFDRRGTWPW